MITYVHIDNENKDILILGEGPTQGLDDTTLTAEAKYPINFTQSIKRFVLSLHYNLSNSFSFVTATKIYQFKAKDSEIKDHTPCLGNNSKEFSINYIKKTGLKFFSVDCNPIDTNDILDIHKYLMKKTYYKTMFVLIKKTFIGLLTGLVNGSNHTKCVLLTNQKCKIQPTLINLHHSEYNQEIHYFPFVVKSDRCVGSCNTLNDLSNKVCVPNKIKDLNMHVFNMIIGKNESKVLRKGISCKFKFKLDGRKYNSDREWNSDKCQCEYWNPATYSCKNGKYLASIIDDSVITCNEIIDTGPEAKSDNEETKAILKNIICETKSFYILLVFY